MKSQIVKLIVLYFFQSFFFLHVSQAQVWACFLALCRHSSWLWELTLGRCPLPTAVLYKNHTVPEIEPVYETPLCLYVKLGQRVKSKRIATKVVSHYCHMFELTLNLYSSPRARNQVPYNYRSRSCLNVSVVPGRNCEYYSSTCFRLYCNRHFYFKMSL